MAGQKRPCRGKFELKTNSKWQLQFDGFKLPLHSNFKAGSNQHCLPKKQAHPPSHPRALHPCPQTALTWTVKQNKALIQVKCQLFFSFGRSISTSIMPLNWITMQMFAEAAGERWHRARSELPGLEKGRSTSSKGSINVCQHGVGLRHHCPRGRKEIPISRAIWLTPRKCYQHPNSTTPTRVGLKATDTKPSQANAKPKRKYLQEESQHMHKEC